MVTKRNILLNVDENDLELLQNNPEKFWEGIEKIGGYAFMFCKKLEEVTLPEQVNDLYRETFYMSNLKKINLSSAITVIPECAFALCENLVDVKMPGKVTKIGRFAFSKCEKLKQINLPNSVKVIEMKAFHGCKKLEKIALPKKLQKLGFGAFDECYNLQAVVIPESLKEVGKYAFDDCEKLKTVIFEIAGEKKTLNIFNNTNISATEIIRTICEDRANFDLYKTYYEQNVPYAIMMNKVEELSQQEELSL